MSDELSRYENMLKVSGEHHIRRAAHEVRKSREQLEREIYKLINDFQRATDMNVTKVDLTTLESIAFSKRATGVEITVEV